MNQSSLIPFMGEEYGSKLDYIRSKKWDGEWTRMLLSTLVMFQKGVAESGKRKRFENYTVDELHSLMFKKDKEDVKD